MPRGAHTAGRGDRRRRRAAPVGHSGAAVGARTRGAGLLRSPRRQRRCRAVRRRPARAAAHCAHAAGYGCGGAATGPAHPGGPVTAGGDPASGRHHAVRPDGLLGQQRPAAEPRGPRPGRTGWALHGGRQFGHVPLTLAAVAPTPARRRRVHERVVGIDGDAAMAMHHAQALLVAQRAQHHVAAVVSQSGRRPVEAAQQ